MNESENNKFCFLQDWKYNIDEPGWRLFMLWLILTANPEGEEMEFLQNFANS